MSFSFERLKRKTGEFLREFVDSNGMRGKQKCAQRLGSSQNSCEDQKDQAVTSLRS